MIKFALFVTRLRNFPLHRLRRNFAPKYALSCSAAIGGHVHEDFSFFIVLISSRRLHTERPAGTVSVRIIFFSRLATRYGWFDMFLGFVRPSLMGLDRI